MPDQCYRGLEGHPTELARIREVQSKLGPPGGEERDDYKEEIGYSAEELAEAKAGVPFGPMPENSPAGVPGAGGPPALIEAGVTSNNSPNPSKAR